METKIVYKLLIVLVLIPLVFSCTTYEKYNYEVTYPFLNDSSYIKIDRLYKNYGKVLYTKDNSTTIEKLYISEGYKIFKPNVSEILKAERLMFQDKSKYYNNDTIGVMKGFSSFYRQYIGFIKPNGDSMVVINLINQKLYDKKYIDDNLYIILDGNNVAVKLPLKVKEIKKQNTTTLTNINITKEIVKN